ncbi:MAG TPA: NAD-dependent epimerase/dehydratase family protein [Candidatus Nanopelagicales bacterium]|nr:NAD-dependent epimerase/dehydratase family protein [Candidatus Nanopelagicales bacterium]
MRLMVLGCGNVGTEVAKRARGLGWQVVATTTSTERQEELLAVADEVAVLTGDDEAAVAAAAQGADAILVAASPRIMQARTAPERAASYRAVLVDSVASAVAACDRVVFLSSISVYGDGRQGSADVLDERTARTSSDEPSSVYFGMAEDVALAAPRGAVLRLADVYGNERDVSYVDRVRMVHEHMGGSAPFAGDGRLHRVHVDDVADAVIHVLTHDLVGAYNCVPDLVPAPTNKEAFDGIADGAGLERIELRGELATPTRQVTSAKLRATGFSFGHPDDALV